jgi:hypothetical protein
MSAIALDFINRHCKNNRHDICHGRWSGFGFEIICSCKCHNRKEQQQALAEVGAPVSNARTSLTQEQTQDDD